MMLREIVATQCADSKQHALVAVGINSAARWNCRQLFFAVNSSYFHEKTYLEGKRKVMMSLYLIN
jgi:hypothetical protein